MHAQLTEQRIKAAISEALAESFRVQRWQLRKMCKEMREEMFEDLILSRAIDAGRRTGFVPAVRIDRLLNRKR